MHTLVSGGGGYIGSAVVQALLNDAGSVTVLDRRPQPAWVSDSASALLRWEQGDVARSFDWQRVVGDVDRIFHLAAIEAPYSADGVVQDYEVNALSVLQLLEACRTAGVAPHIILASSANLYGQVDHLPVNESTRDNPGRVWSAHKLLAEQYARLLSAEYEIPVTILRLANVYGPTPAPGSDEHIVINKVIRACRMSDAITVFANAQCTRDYLYLPDLVAAFLAAGEHLPSRCTTYVVGSGEAVTLAQTWHLIARVMNKITGRTIAVKTDTSQVLDQAEYRNFVADSRKFSTATNWHPTTALSDGLLATAEWAMLQSYATTT